ncbi:hypothetical protein ACFSTH_13090 [Paenibacillus yanchengensis]|uniref:Lipoprotein n=1 Tax=Paenibacillus yanchengensis TaxID=2035833 RepID=A0ABW4YNW6_9BACL
MRITTIMTVLIGIVMLLLVSCEQSPTNNHQPEAFQQQKEVTETSIKAEDDTPLFMEIKVDYVTNELMLYDRLNNKQVQSVALEPHTYVGSMKRIDEGYVIEMFAGNEPTQVQRKSGMEIVYPPSTWQGLTYHIYDEQLKLVDEIEVTNLLPESMQNINNFKAVSKTGDIFLWSNGWETYTYEIGTQQIEQLSDESHPLSWDKAAFTHDNKGIVFFGKKDDGNEVKFHYGFMDRSSKKVTLYEDDPQFQGNNIQISDYYAIITDDVYINSEQSSGKLLLLELESGKSVTLQVDDTESTTAVISSDSEFVIAAKILSDNQLRVRQYQINEKQFGKIVKEEIYDVENSIGKIIEINSDANNKYYPLIIEQSGTYQSVVFVSEG